MPLATFFSAERFGRPQVLASLLLLAFVCQCVWLVARGTQPLEVEPAQLYRVQEGLLQWHGRSVAGTPSMERLQAGINAPPEVEQNDGYDPNHSPLWYLIASAPLLAWRGSSHANALRYWGWLARVPYLVFGVLLGASLWYVSRRLYGNAGGYIALTLYCFSPTIIRASTLWMAQPEIGAAWASFGAIFTAIAVAHTLYAPREVVLWNWRRILLLGLSLTLAIGSQFSLVLLAPMALAFMLYVAPTRRRAAIAIWAAACAVTLVLLFAAYSYQPSVFWASLRHATWSGATWRALLIPETYKNLLATVAQSNPALIVAFPILLAVYLAWRRSRYFGNTAPLLVAALFLLLGLASPHYSGLGFQLMAIPFLFVFVAGVTADLLETRHRNFVNACVCGVLAATSLWNLLELAMIKRG